MILRLSIVHENARSALECGGLTPPSSLGLHALGTPRRRQAAALQGAFGTAIFMAARNLALIPSSINQGEIPPYARNDMATEEPGFSSALPALVRNRG
jgi:hypothetical protein